MGTPLELLKKEVFNELGSSLGEVSPSQPMLNLELSEDQFHFAVKLAKQWFTARKGFVVYRPIPVYYMQNAYKMAPDVMNIQDVIFQAPNDLAAFFTLGFFDLIPYGPQGLGAMNLGLNDYASFAQILQFIEQRKRVFSVDPQWWFEPQTQLLHITYRLGTVNNFILVQAKLNDFKPEMLHDKDDWIFGRYVRAKCKEIVGRIRSKYDSLPSAGGSISLDGKDLIAESKEEFEKLDQEIFASQGPDLPLIA